MAHEIEVIGDQEALSSLSPETVNPDLSDILIVDIGGGLLRFSDALFPGVGRDDVYAQKFSREPEGTGPHFDLHAAYLNTSYPWIGVYNLVGNNTIRTVRMPDKLLESYLETYPDADEPAYAARRHFGAIALESEHLDIGTGVFDTNMALVLPQAPSGPQIVHEIVPKDPQNPGAFVKLTTAAGEKAVSELKDLEYVPLDELVTEALGGVIRDKERAHEGEEEFAGMDLSDLVEHTFSRVDADDDAGHGSRARRWSPPPLRRGRGYSANRRVD